MPTGLAARLDQLLAEAGSAGLRQPDPRSCGAASLVVARMLLDPAYAGQAGASFHDEVLATHRRVTGTVDARGALQLPWPRIIGTPPWAVDRELSAASAHDYDDRLVLGREPAYERLVGSLLPAALFVGSAWLPRHVVLVVAADDQRLTCYEPSRGVRADVDRSAFLGARLRLAGWDRPWITVTT